MKNKTITGIACLFALSTGVGTTAETVKILYGTSKNVFDSNGGKSNTNALIDSKYGVMKWTHTTSATSVSWQKGTTFHSTFDVQNQNSDTQLANLRNNSDLQSMRNRRDTQNCDVLQLWCDWTDGGTLGLASQPGWTSIVRRQTLTVTSGSSKFTASHEIGHNLNASHGHGYCFSNNRRTIMEPNNSSCSGRTRQNTFSSSTRKWSNVTVGNSSNMNRERVISQSPTTARYQ